MTVVPSTGPKGVVISQPAAVGIVIVGVAAVVGLICWGLDQQTQRKKEAEAAAKRDEENRQEMQKVQRSYANLQSHFQDLIEETLNDSNNSCKGAI